MLRGRQGRQGFRNMSLSTFCDIVWAEIWDDCSPMGDQPQYREIVYQLFIEGKEPHEIFYLDAKGKRKALGPATSGTADGSPPKDQMSLAQEWQERIRQAREAAGVASIPDGERRSGDPT